MLLLNCGAGEVLQHWQTGSLPLAPPGKPTGSDIRSQIEGPRPAVSGPTGPCSKTRNEMGGALKAAAESFRGRVQAGWALPLASAQAAVCRGVGGGSSEFHV